MRSKLLPRLRALFRKTWTGWFLVLISSFLTLLVIFIGAEIYARCCAGRSMVIRQIESGNPFTINSDRFYLTRETDKGKRLVRNAQVMILNHSISGRDIPITTNSQGFRYDQLDREKPSGEYRVLFLGDSVTLNNYLPEEETFTRIAESRMYQAGYHNVKLINAGVEDIGLTEEIEILKEEGLSIHPDLVVVNFFLNDSRPPWGFDEELGHPGWLRRHSFATEWLYKRLKLSEWFSHEGSVRMRWVDDQYKYKWWENEEDFRRLAASASYDWGAAWEHDSWKTTENRLKELKDLGAINHFRVAVVVFPVKFQLRTNFIDNYPQQQMKELAEKYEFHFLDLLPALFKAHREGLQSGLEDKVYLDHAHLTTYGNEIAGEEIAAFLGGIRALSE